MSLRLALTDTFSRAVLKRRLGRLKTPEAARKDFDRFAALVARVPRGTRIEHMRVAAPCPPLVRVSSGPADPRRVLLWFHGGAFIAGSPNTHRGLAAHLSRKSGLPVVLPDYRLAPEHPYPAAWDDSLAAWKALRAHGLAADDIALGGDSAGGCLALSLMARLCAEGAPPAAAVLFSPLTDLTGGGRSVTENAASDRLLPAQAMEEVVTHALAGHARTDPRASPLFATFRDPPPVLFQVAESEILRDDSLRMASVLRASAGTVQVETLPDAPHVWQLLVPWLPEANASVASAAAFLERVFRTRPGPQAGS